MSQVLSWHYSWLFRNHSFTTGDCAKTKACSEARSSCWVSNESGMVRGSFFQTTVQFFALTIWDCSWKESDCSFLMYFNKSQKKQRDLKPNSNLSSSRTPAKNRSSNWSPASSTALLAPLQPPNQVNRSKPIFSTTRKLNNPNADLDSGEGKTHFPHGGVR